jgi:hypothetical protein
MAKPKSFSPYAILFRHPHKTEQGFVQLVGTDPDEADPSKLYIWPDVYDGWARRRSCSLSTANFELLHQNCGKTSSWPGSNPMPPEKKPLGRPPMSPEEKLKKIEQSKDREVVHVKLHHDLAIKAMQRAASEGKMLQQWILGLVETALE